MSDTEKARDPIEGDSAKPREVDRASRRPGALRRAASAVVVLGCVGVVAAVAAWANTGTVEVPRSPQPIVVPVAPVEWTDSFAVERRFVGEVRARRSVELGFELSGRVVELLFDDGDRVGAGEVVARLDTRRLSARRAELVAVRAEVEADLRLARLTLERAERSFASRAASEQEVDQAAQSVAAAEARLAQASSSIESIDVDLEKSILRAPFDATVSRRMVDEGAVVSEGRSVLHLLEDTRPEARIGVPVSVLPSLGRGDRVPVTVGPATVEGRVIAALPQVDARTRTADVRIELDGTLGGALRDGAAAEVAVSIEQDGRGFAVPVTALTQSVRGLWAVYVLAPAEEGVSRIERREVEVVHVESDVAVVRGSIADGALVVTGGTQKIAPGVAAVAGGDATREEGGDAD